MILYIRDGCQWCEEVLAFAEKNGIVFSCIKNKSEPGVINELIERGGKAQFPYLVDVENAVEMYESEDIIAYLSSMSGTSSYSTEGPRVCTPDFDE